MRFYFVLSKETVFTPVSVYYWLSDKLRNFLVKEFAIKLVLQVMKSFQNKQVEQLLHFNLFPFIL